MRLPATLFGVLASTSCVLAGTTSHHNQRVLPTYDYVIVGSGPGGGPLATRLARAGKTVLLIDAGADQGDEVLYQVPALSLNSVEFTPMRWDYYSSHYTDLDQQKKDSKMSYRTASGELYVGTDPPPNAEPLGILYPRTGALGGCSAHNAMISIYPHESDWNGIASLTGDSSWSASNMRNYFTRLENCEYLPSSVSGHGYNGWFTTSLTDLSLVVKDPKLLAIILNAAKAMGQVPGLLLSLIRSVTGLTNVLLNDLNSGSPSRDSTEGVYQMPIATDNGVRSGPRPFILETANAKNGDGSRKYHLDIMLNTLVTNVRFDQSGATPHAVGVDFLTGESLYRADPQSGGAGVGIPGSVDASSEVILAAGAFNTPQLLKLSGIGPAEELESFDIPVVVDLPGVGTNLQDRVETTIIAKTHTDFAVIKKCEFNRSPDDPCLKQWQTGINPTTKGVYASNGIAVAIVKKTSFAAEGDDPDLFVAGAPVGFKGYYDGYSAHATADSRHWTWLTLKAHTRNNAGTVRLRSTDPLDTPIIDFNHFNSPGADADADALVEGMKFTRSLIDSMGYLFEKEVWPGTNVSSDASLKEFVKDEAWGHHASCTCPIGADGDPMAVLDSQFQVRGVDGLRVVDASVFPKIPGFFIAVPVYMISEKAADVILGA